MHLIQISLIFLRCRRTKPDGISEIVCSKPWHDRIQINDTKSLSGLCIKQNIVQLRIIVCHSKRQRSILLLFY